MPLGVSGDNPTCGSQIFGRTAGLCPVGQAVAEQVGLRQQGLQNLDWSRSWICPPYSGGSGALVLRSIFPREL